MTVPSEASIFEQLELGSPSELSRGSFHPGTASAPATETDQSSICRVRRPAYALAAAAQDAGFDRQNLAEARSKASCRRIV